MMQKANVGHGKTKDGQDYEKERFSLRHPLKALNRVRVVIGAVLMSMARNKVIKRQRRGKQNG
jgi:hypothetical protein